MIPCHGCHRHVRDQERTCPFCSATLRQASAPLRELAEMIGAVGMSMVLLGAVGCAKDSVEDPQASSTSESGEDTGTGTTADTTETSSEATTMSSFTDTDDTTDPQTNTSGGFYAGPDTDWGSVSECDPFAQDCPEGEKCVPYGSTGGNWDANKCVPVTGDGAAGDSCIYAGVIEATDDCDELTHCWDVMDVDGMNVGVCTPFCTGTADDPICPMGSSCVIANEGSITMCISTCDPLLQDCSEGTACFPNPNTLDFNCFFTLTEAPTGEPCGYINDCASGNACVAAELVLDCDNSSCCAIFCDLEDVEACADLPMTVCTSFFGEETSAPGYENVGLCVLPAP